MDAAAWMAATVPTPPTLTSAILLPHDGDLARRHCLHLVLRAMLPAALSRFRRIIGSFNRATRDLVDRSCRSHPDWKRRTIVEFPKNMKV
jgi:hypothetical protein